MNQYTVAADFVEHCGPISPETLHYWYNVLAIFHQDNKFKLCVDDKGQAIEVYRNLGLKYESIRFWLQSMLTNPNRNVIQVACPETADTRILFIEITKATVCLERKLIVCKKEMYRDVMPMIKGNQILLLDGEEAKDRLAPKEIRVQIAIGDNVTQSQ